MFVVPAWSLKIPAAIVWYGGGIALLLKGSSLLVEANGLQPGQGWPWLAVVIGMFLGYLKARYLFSKSCRRNLDRITTLERPRIWQYQRTPTPTPGDAGSQRNETNNKQAAQMVRDSAYSVSLSPAYSA